MFDITFIVEFIITLAVSLITAFLLPYLKTKFTAEKISSAYEVIKILVNAIEQTTKVSGQGAKKKAWVLERLQNYNIKIDESKVNELIEASVHEMNNAVANKDKVGE